MARQWRSMGVSARCVVVIVSTSAVVGLMALL